MPKKESGYFSVSIYKDLHDAIETKAKEMNISMSECIRVAFDYYIDHTNLYRVLKRCGLQGGEQIFDWNNIETRKLFNNLFNSLTWYKSTEWIMSEDHDKEIGDSEWPDELKTRIEKCQEFRFDKIIIVSDSVWESPRVWRWIWQKYSILNVNPDKPITILVTREKEIKKNIKTKYYDMGIYGDDTEGPFMGFLDRKPQQDTTVRQYRWRYPPDESLENAEIAFQEIGKKNEPPEVVTNMLWKHGLSRMIREHDTAKERNMP